MSWFKADGTLSNELLAYQYIIKNKDESSYISKGSIKHTIELILNDYRVSTFLKTKKIYYNIGAYRSSVLKGKEIRKKII